MPDRPTPAVPAAPVHGPPARSTLVALAAAVVAAHIALLGWLPAGELRGRPVDEKTLHLVTRVVPPPPAPAPAPAPARKPAPRRAAPPPASPAPAPAPEEVAADAAPTDAAASDGAPSDAGGADTSPPDTGSAASPAPPAPAPAPAAAPPPPPPPVGLPAPVRLRYRMNGESKGLVYHARAELLWQQDGARYNARMEVSAFLLGSRVQTSEGAIGPGGLEPERFADKARRETATHFDRAGQRIVFSSNAPEAPLQPGTQDRLGVFLQLGSLLAGDPQRYPQGAAITVPTASTRDVGDWTFVVGPPETLELPIGAQATVKLERAPRKDYDTRVEVWLAPALGYLPVRMRITQASGDFIDQQLDSAEQP